MATYQGFDQGRDFKNARSFLNQLIDVLQEDISGSVSRRKYQHFVTGGIGPGVTSSLFQTVYDQDFTLQTANPVFDITVGLAPPDVLGDGIAHNASTGIDSNGKYLYPSSSMMMREKINIYSQFSQVLLGNANTLFQLNPYPNLNPQPVDDGFIDAALFIAFKRLFSRDQIKRETFAMRFYSTASNVSITQPFDVAPPDVGGKGVMNLNVTSTSGSKIYTDLGSATSQFSTYGGQYGLIVDSANTANNVGLMFYDAGVAVFDLERITSASQFVSGVIDSMNPLGVQVLGAPGTEYGRFSKFIPDFIASASIDNIVDHICSARFQSGSLTAITFQNVTNINSTLIFCRATADNFNYSSNPTYVDTDGRIVVIEPGQEAIQESFTFITSVGMYDANNNLLAVAKLSRPVEKNNERDLTFRVRLDF